MGCFTMLKYSLVLFGLTGPHSFEIPEFVYDYCKYTNICNRSAISEPPTGKISCCTSCSCDDDCGLTLDCCFDHIDKHKLVDNGLVTCIVSSVGSNLIRHSMPTYYMVTSCSYFNASTVQNQYDDECRWKDENGTSFVGPVTDMNTNTTFVHEACAKCNGVNSFVKWDYVYHKNAGLGTNQASTMWTLEVDTGENTGSRTFIPSDEIRNSAKECFISPKLRSCGNTAADSVCQSLNAPFRYQTYTEFVYKNVACSSCGRPNINYPESCEESFAKNWLVGKLTVLVDITVLEEISNFQNTAEKTNMASCNAWSVRSNLKDGCLQVYCPESMFRTDKGCQYLFPYWYTNMIFMQFKLVPTPATLLPVKTLQSLSESDFESINKWIELPCQRIKPFVYDIYYENASFEYVKSLNVRLVKRTSATGGFPPPTYFPLLKRCTYHPWTFHLGKRAYTFIPELDRYIDYVQDGRTNILWQTTLTLVEFIRPKLYDALTLIPRKYLQQGPRLVVRKTFFCRKVRLPMDEVEVNVEEIRILSTNKTLGNNEYDLNNASTIFSDQGLVDSSVLVCINDYIESGAVSYRWTASVLLLSILKRTLML